MRLIRYNENGKLFKYKKDTFQRIASLKNVLLKSLILLLHTCYKHVAHGIISSTFDNVPQHL